MRSCTALGSKTVLEVLQRGLRLVDDAWRLGAVGHLLPAHMHLRALLLPPLAHYRNEAEPILAVNWRRPVVAVVSIAGGESGTASERFLYELRPSFALVTQAT